MSKQEMQDQEVMDMANRAEKKKNPPAGAGKEAVHQCQERAKQCLPKGFWRALRAMFAEVLGWTCFGGLTLANMVIRVAPMWLAVPVFTGCFVWVGIRMDRFFRSGAPRSESKTNMIAGGNHTYTR